MTMMMMMIKKMTLGGDVRRLLLQWLHVPLCTRIASCISMKHAWLDRYYVLGTQAGSK